MIGMNSNKMQLLMSSDFVWGAMSFIWHHWEVKRGFVMEDIIQMFWQFLLNFVY